MWRSQRSRNSASVPLEGSTYSPPSISVISRAHSFCAPRFVPLKLCHLRRRLPAASYRSRIIAKWPGDRSLICPLIVPPSAWLDRMRDPCRFSHSRLHRRASIRRAAFEPSAAVSAGRKRSVDSNELAQLQINRASQVGSLEQHLGPAGDPSKSRSPGTSRTLMSVSLVSKPRPPSRRRRMPPGSSSLAPRAFIEVLK